MTRTVCTGELCACQSASTNSGLIQVPIDLQLLHSRNAHQLYMNTSKEHRFSCDLLIVPGLEVM